MENKIDEGEIKGSIDPATKSQTKIILEQMEKSVCKIIGKKDGTGFFCKIESDKGKIPVLVTNYHIIDDKFLEQNSKLKIQIGDGPIPKEIYINKSRIIYSSKNEEYDIMIIELNKRDDLKNINYLEIDDYLLNDNSESAYVNKSIYILHYPMGREITVSYGYGITKEKGKKFDIIHKCKTTNGSSGSPILNLATNKLIGIHKSYIQKKNSCYNIGSFLKYALIEIQKKTHSNRKKNIDKFFTNKINKIKTKFNKNKKNERSIDDYAQLQFNIKDNNNINNVNFITDYKNEDYNTLDNKNDIYSRNINNLQNFKKRINQKLLYNHHNYTKSNRDFNKIGISIANEKIEEEKCPNLNLNYGIKNNNSIVPVKQKFLPNDKNNKNTILNKHKSSNNSKKKLSSNKPSDIIEKNIYKKDNYLTNNRKYVANDKNNLLLNSENTNKINQKRHRIASTPILNRNSDINYRDKQTRLFKPENTQKK